MMGPDSESSSEGFDGGSSGGGSSGVELERVSKYDPNVENVT